MKANVDKGLDPLGRNGDQVAKAFGTTNTGHDNGATEYIEQGYKKLNGGKEMKGPCGKGCQNSMYHKFEEVRTNYALFLIFFAGVVLMGVGVFRNRKRLSTLRLILGPVVIIR